MAEVRDFFPLPEIMNSGTTEVTNYQDMWVANDNILNNIASFLSRKDIISKLTQFFSTNVGGAITGITMYPFTISSDMLESSSSTIKISGIAVNQKGSTSDLTSKRIKNTVTLCAEYNLQFPTPEEINFLDYEPFTTYELYVPFVGVVPLTAKMVLGKTITLQYMVDFHTGRATVYLNNDTENIFTGSTKIGINVPFGATNEGEMDTARTLGAIKTGLSLGFGMIGTPGREITKTTSAQTTTVSSSAESSTPRISQSTGRLLKPAQSMSTKETNIVRGGVTETTSYPATEGRPDPATAVNGILSLASDKHTYLGYSVAEDFSQFTAPLTPYLIITRTHIHDIEDYGHYFGYACAEKIRLGDHHGYCEISNIQMEGMAGVTAYEIDVIENYLKNGVILP